MIYIYRYSDTFVFCISQYMLVAGEVHLWPTKVSRRFSTQPCKILGYLLGNSQFALDKTIEPVFDS